MYDDAIQLYSFDRINSLLFSLRCSSYISFDILRRVLTNYFGYNVLYVMNITDIDDKIIKRARQNYLYEEYLAAEKSLEQILDDHKHVLNQLNDVIQKNTDPDKKVLLDRSLQQCVFFYYLCFIA